MLLRGRRIGAWRHRGVAALEFAIIAPALVAIILAIVYYGVVLALQQVLTLAAEEGARAALRYPSGATSGSAGATQALRISAASTTALATLPASIAALIPQGGIAQAVSCASASGNVCVRVTLNLATTQVLPAIPMVPVPPTLSGSAIVQLSPDT